MTKKLTIELFQKIALSNGGECLSSHYFNDRTPLPWRCSLGHRWEAAPRSIRGSGKKRGTWCPYCAGQRGATIEFFKELALRKEGRCLSSVYKNAHLKLHWQCKNDHTWGASANSIKRGSWCPECYKRRIRIK